MVLGQPAVPAQGVCVCVCEGGGGYQRISRSARHIVSQYDLGQWSEGHSEFLGLLPAYYIHASCTNRVHAFLTVERLQQAAHSASSNSLFAFSAAPAVTLIPHNWVYKEAGSSQSARRV